MQDPSSLRLFLKTLIVPKHIPKQKLYSLYAAVALICALVIGIPLYLENRLQAGADRFTEGATIKTTPLGGSGSGSGTGSGSSGGTAGGGATTGGQTGGQGQTPSGTDTTTETDVVTNKTIQQQLAVVGCYSGTIDGILGMDSFNAITTYQKASNLSADGILGPATQNALSRDAANQKKVCVSSSNGTSTVFQNPVSDNAVTQSRGGWTSYYKTLLATVGYTLANFAIQALTGHDSVAAAVVQQATQAALLGYTSQQATHDAVARGLITGASDVGPIDTGAGSTAGASDYNDIFTLPPDNITGGGAASSGTPAASGLPAPAGAGGVNYSQGGTSSSGYYGTGTSFDQYLPTANYYDTNNQAPTEMSMMCFVGPALLPSATELVAKIPYVGDILNGLLTSYVAYKSYSDCGNYYGQYAYDPYTGQPTYLYNQPVRFSYEPVGGTMAIVARGPYEDLKSNLLDLTGYIPVLGSPMAASILFNN